MRPLARHVTRHTIRRAGFTVLEVLLASTILAIVAAKAYIAMSVASETSERQTRETVLDDQARIVLRRIAYAVMGANRETLLPDSEAPLSTNDLRYQVNLGIQDGEVVWSDPEEIGVEAELSQVYWSQNPETETERRVVWTNLVAPYLEGELPNGMDDNGNGLIDESGLSFAVDRDAVRIRITLQRVTDDGELVSRMLETTVTCRNLGEEDS